MADFTPEELDEFLSKTEFDFGTVAGWEEFLAERRLGGPGASADGPHLRDIKNYAVGVANVISSGTPIPVRVNIRQPGSGLALAPATMFVYYPDASGTRQVRRFMVGGGTANSQDERFEVAGGGTQFSPWWDVIYYIVIKVGDLPGQGAAEWVARRQLTEALRAGGWMMRRGFGLLRRGGGSYSVSFHVGSLQVQRDEFMDQENMPREAFNSLSQATQSAWDAINQ